MDERTLYFYRFGEYPPLPQLEPLGNGWYLLPDGRKIRGYDNALAALEDK